MLIDEEQIRRLNKTMSIGGSVFDNSKNTVPEDIKCSNCSISKEDWYSDDNSSNWEPLRKSEEGPETALKDSDDDCAVPVCPVMGPPRQDDADDAHFSEEEWDTDDNLSDLDALDGNVVMSNCSEDSENEEPLPRSEGPETVLEDSDTDEDCAVPDGSVPGPPQQDDPDEEDCPFEAYHGESPYGRKCYFVF